MDRHFLKKHEENVLQISRDISTKNKQHWCTHKTNLETKKKWIIEKRNDSVSINKSFRNCSIDSMLPVYYTSRRNN